MVVAGLNARGGRCRRVEDDKEVVVKEGRACFSERFVLEEDRGSVPARSAAGARLSLFLSVSLMYACACACVCS